MFYFFSRFWRAERPVEAKPSKGIATPLTQSLLGRKNIAPELDVFNAIASSFTSLPIDLFHYVLSSYNAAETPKAFSPKTHAFSLHPSSHLFIPPTASEISSSVPRNHLQERDSRPSRWITRKSNQTTRNTPSHARSDESYDS